MAMPLASKTPSEKTPPGDSTVNEVGENGRQQEQNSGEQEQEKKPLFLDRVNGKLGLDMSILLVMFKGACAPIISLALYQYEPFASHFPTLGYLVAIASILCMPIMPRAKFIQTMIFNLIAVCIGGAIALLICYCSVQARAHTSVPVESVTAGASGAQQAVTYNSSASVVSAVWLFVNIMFSNALRFSRPQLQLTIILYSIFGNISGTFAPLFATMTQSISFVEMIMEAFLAGFGISTVVHFLVVPMSSRGVLFKSYTGYIATLKAVMVSQRSYLQSMEKVDMLASKQGAKKGSKQELAAKDLKGSLQALIALHGKLHTDLPFAKRETAYGKLDAKDIDDIFQNFRAIFLPVLGLGSVVDIFTRISEKQGWAKASDSDADSGEHVSGEEKSKPIAEQEGWNEIMQALHEPFFNVSTAAIEGLTHASYALELAEKPKKKKRKQEASTAGRNEDVEASAVKQPGDLQYSEHLEARLEEFNETRKLALKNFCQLKGINVEDVSDLPVDPADSETIEEATHGPNRQQLYMILYMEHLLYSTAHAILELVKFADKKVADGTMERKRFINPGMRRIRKWMKTALSVEDSSNDNLPDHAEAGTSSVQLGDAFQHRKDPEHLPPANAFESFGNNIRTVSHIMSSPEVTFGFRVACATMSIAIVAYLRVSQAFFVEQRLVWAMIMVAIGMTMTSGSGMFGFLGRVGGTFIAMCLSIIIWYIAGGTGVPGGVLPVLFVAMMIEFYFLIKFPKFTVVAMITIVTQVLILGYELQARKIGVAAVSSNGQKYYAIYLLAPYRLATVAGGCFVAFIWTYFPYPITARTALRQQLGASVYLLANYYSCVYSTIRMRLDGTGGDPQDKYSPNRQLEKAREKILGKQLGLLASLRQHSAFVPFEFSFGGKFPKDTYDRIILTVQHLVNYMALMSYSTRVYEGLSDCTDRDQSQWVKDLAKISTQLSSSSQEITSLLAMVSSALTSGSPLPPYLTPPQPYQMTKRLNALDPDLLSLRHITEPGYAAFAVTQVSGRLIHDDLSRLLSDVKSLVGEVDFSFHIVSTASNSDLTLGKDGKDKRD